MTQLRELASAPLPISAACDDEWFAKCMKSMDILPKRQDDAIGGLMRFNLYKRQLGGFSNEALSYLAMQSTKTCHWFPSIAECLELLRAWPNRSRDADRKDKAEHLIRREMNLRMDGVVASLGRREMDQAEIDALPLFWKQVAAEKGYLWGWPDGRFTIRHDLDKLDPEERDAERERIRAMFDEWERIKAGAEGSADV